MTALDGGSGKEPTTLLPKHVEEPKIPSPLAAKSDILAPAAEPILNGEQKYTVLEEPNRVGKKIKVITIGAGASSLNFAHDIDTNPLDIDLTIYEKNPEIGGTWFENRYPGCACDIPSVVYQLSWAPSAEWSSYYSTAPEILAYFKKLAEKYNLLKYVRLSHRVVGAFWQEDTQEWLVKIQRGDNPEDVFEDRCNILVNASGVLK